ncbi:unnamed protein product [Rhizoctonia solani]|uniref:Uncharacterized protein n=1 Tax=Rhizoctonia solani TaxID=456999 RepID=A0A8H3AND4_9AGAM|nr:unnamed protein product [Rhizoctonia solani]
MPAQMSQLIKQRHVIDSPNHTLGTTREYPENEAAPLREELLFHEPGTPFGRVISCFEFQLNGKPVAVSSDLIPEDGSGNLEVVGITGTIYNKEGQFAQCGWFGNHDLDWFWVRIKGIKALNAERDPRFRAGQWCIWLHTQLGQYALLLPRESYREMWEETAAGLGSNGLAALFRQWPACGPRPSWWGDKWQDAWPFESEAGSKRRASTELEQYEAQARGNEKPPGKWVLLGTRSEKGNRGQMRTNLGQRGQWELSPHGMMATRSGQSAGANQQDSKPAGKATSRSRGRGKTPKRQ